MHCGLCEATVRGKQSHNTPTKGVYILIPRTCKLRELRLQMGVSCSSADRKMERLSWIINVSPIKLHDLWSNRRALKAGAEGNKVGQRDVTRGRLNQLVWALKMEWGGHKPETTEAIRRRRQPSGSAGNRRKGRILHCKERDSAHKQSEQETQCPLDLQKERSAATLVSVWWDPCPTSATQTGK